MAMARMDAHLCGWIYNCHPYDCPPGRALRAGGNCVFLSVGNRRVLDYICKHVRKWKYPQILFDQLYPRHWPNCHLHNNVFHSKRRSPNVLGRTLDLARYSRTWVPLLAPNQVSPDTRPKICERSIQNKVALTNKKLNNGYRL